MEALIKTCPKCHSERHTKDGIVGNRQRYKCKDCLYRYTVIQRGFSANIKRQALVLYLQGLDFRSIARVLHCSHVTVYNWIKSHGKGVEEIRSETGIKQVSIYQLNKYITDKKNNAESSLLLIDIENSASATLCVTELELNSIKNKELEQKTK